MILNKLLPSIIIGGGSKNWKKNNALKTVFLHIVGDKSQIVLGEKRFVVWSVVYDDNSAK